MTRDEALNKAIVILTYNQVNFCKSKEAVANMNEIIDALEKIDQECVADKDINVTATDCIRRQDVEDAIYDYSRSCDVNYAQIMEFIDKLPSVSPQPCEDCISRQAVLDVIEREQFKGDAISEIEKLPSVSPQQKMGKWIMSDDGLYRPICNNCGAHPWKGYIPTVEEATDVFKYCPNCGAKMSEIPTGAEGSDNE